MLERKHQGDPAAEGQRSRGCRSRDLKKAVLERTFEGTDQQGAIEVGGYRSRGLEKAVLESELSGDIAIEVGDGKWRCWRERE